MGTVPVAEPAPGRGVVRIGADGRLGTVHGLEDTRLVCLGPYDPELDIRFSETFGNQLLPWDVELLTA